MHVNPASSACCGREIRRRGEDVQMCLTKVRVDARAAMHGRVALRRMKWSCDARGGLTGTGAGKRQADHGCGLGRCGAGTDAGRGEPRAVGEQ